MELKARVVAKRWKPGQRRYVALEELWAHDLAGYYDPADSYYFAGMKLEVGPVKDGVMNDAKVYEVRSLGRMEGRYRLLTVEEV